MHRQKNSNKLVKTTLLSPPGRRAGASGLPSRRRFPRRHKLAGRGAPSSPAEPPAPPFLAPPPPPPSPLYGEPDREKTTAGTKSDSKQQATPNGLADACEDGAAVHGSCGLLGGQMEHWRSLFCEPPGPGPRSKGVSPTRAMRGMEAWWDRCRGGVECFGGAQEHS